MLSPVLDPKGQADGQTNGDTTSMAIYRADLVCRRGRRVVQRKGGALAVYLSASPMIHADGLIQPNATAETVAYRAPRRVVLGRVVGS